MRTRALLAAAAAALLVGVASMLPPPPVEAQLVPQDGGRLAGLRWTFVRVRYTANTAPGRYRMEYWGEPWAIDGPAAEQNLSRRIKTVTTIDVGAVSPVTAATRSKLAGYSTNLRSIVCRSRGGM